MAACAFICCSMATFGRVDAVPLVSIYFWLKKNSPLRAPGTDLSLHSFKHGLYSSDHEISEDTESDSCFLVSTLS